MSVPLEHDYIGLSEASLMEKTSESSNFESECDKNNVLNLKATELRLGLPGLGHDLDENPLKNNSPMKNYVSRAKRGFSDVNFNGGIEGDLDKGSSSSSTTSPTSVLFKINGGLESKQIQKLVSISVEEKKKGSVTSSENGRVSSASKAQVVGWPPIRSFRKNTMATNLSKNEDVAKGNSACGGCLYVKVSMDGAPYLRKVDLKTCNNYKELSMAVQKLFTCFTLGQCTSNGLRGKEGLSESNLKDLLHNDECVLTYEDKDGDWMLVGDVPWEMFVDSCKRLRIMKGSEAIGLAPRSMEKCKNQIREI